MKNVGLSAIGALLISSLVVPAQATVYDITPSSGRGFTNIDITVSGNFFPSEGGTIFNLDFTGTIITNGLGSLTGSKSRIRIQVRGEKIPTEFVNTLDSSDFFSSLRLLIFLRQMAYLQLKIV